MPTDPTIPSSPESGNLPDPDRLPYSLDAVKTGAQACEVLWEIMRVLRIDQPATDPLAPASELIFSGEEIRGRVRKQRKDELVELLAQIEMSIRLSHTGPEQLARAARMLDGWQLVMSARKVVTREKFLRLLDLI